MLGVNQAQLHLMPNVDQARLDLLHKYWNATNYLTVGQIYLQDNPLLQEPLRPEHIKPRLLGHWGTSPGLSFRSSKPAPSDEVSRPKTAASA